MRRMKSWAPHFATVADSSSLAPLAKDLQRGSVITARGERAVAVQGSTVKWFGTVNAMLCRPSDWSASSATIRSSLVVKASPRQL
jgi:hypothetical protein